jgi:ribosomal protein L7Ae-like RNA K-turn-binding protein
VEEYNYYILFPNVTEGLKLEKLLKESNIKYTIVPTPRELSKCCGICIMYEIGDEDSIKLVVERHGIKTEGFKSLPKRKPAVKFV